MHRYVRVLLGCILAFVSVWALAGGIGLMVNGLDMPEEYLERIPFVSCWFIPGLLLFIFNGIGSGWAAYWCFTHRGKQAAAAGLLFGIVLTVWIIVQVILIGFVSPLQPIYGVIGLIEIFLASSLYK